MNLIKFKQNGLIEEHKAIVEAIINHDDKQAVQLLEEHLKKDLEFSLYYLINNIAPVNIIVNRGYIHICDKIYNCRVGI